jgi:hypothetical protein
VFPYFPLGIKGTIRLRVDYPPADIVSRAVRHIESMLEAAAASSVETNGAEVTFTARMFRGVSNWNVLIAFGSGQIHVEPDVNGFIVRYELSTTRMFLIVTGMMAIASLFAISKVFSVGFVAFGWAWLFGANYVMAMIRFPLWLKGGLWEALRATAVAATG